jgi:hypothetical protein
VNLYELKTYHEVIDEIYYKVTHLEPWEKGSRKTAGQTGMCGGVSVFVLRYRDDKIRQQIFKLKLDGQSAVFPLYVLNSVLIGCMSFGHIVL